MYENKKKEENKKKKDNHFRIREKNLKNKENVKEKK